MTGHRDVPTVQVAPERGRAGGAAGCPVRSLPDEGAGAGCPVRPTPVEGPPHGPAEGPPHRPAESPYGNSGGGRSARRARRLRRARWRDRRVHTRSHPFLLALLAVTRSRPVLRVGGTLLVHGTDAYREALTRVPLDRTATGTTGGTARELASGGGLFDQQGAEHRSARRGLGDTLASAGVQRLRPVWQEVLGRRLAGLAAGKEVDLVSVARELSGATVAALLCAPGERSAATGADGRCGAEELAAAAGEAASAAVRAHLSRPARPGAARRAARAAARLEALLPVPGGGAPERSTGSGDALPAVLAVAAVNTTVAALPRAAAWCADADLWEAALSEELRPALVTELLRVTAASPVLPRVAAGAGTVAGRRVRAGDRMVLVARHAARAHSVPPDPHRPEPAAVAQLVFGTGSHACPGALLARVQAEDFLAALAPYRPEVVRARADRRSALPSWRELRVRATTGTGTAPATAAASVTVSEPGAATGRGSEPGAATGSAKEAA